MLTLIPYADAISPETTTLRWESDQTMPRKRPKKNKAVLTELGLVQNGFPKYAPAYDVIRSAFPEFEWHAHSAGKCKQILFHGYPTWNGQHPTLADLVSEILNGDVKKKSDTFAPYIAKAFDVVLQQPNGRSLVNAFLSLGIILPSQKIGEAIAEWWKSLQKGQLSTIATTICPDYAYIETGNPNRSFMYTFDLLGTGIGLVAQRALKACTYLHDVFTRMGLSNIQFVFAMADCEADTPANLCRVKLTRDEFVQRMRLSQEALNDAFPKEMSVHTPFITELDKQEWEALLARAHEDVKNEKFGALNIRPWQMEEICRLRENLYKKWFGCTSFQECQKIFYRQIPEYMAPTTLLEQHYPNVLHLGADAPAMAPFMHGLSEKIRPVLYLKPVY